MRARDVVGKTIVAIKQERKNTQQFGRSMVTAIEAIILNDGSEIRFVTIETEHGYYLTEAVVRLVAR